MKSGDFELEIVGGVESPDTCRVEMRQRQVYQIKPTNYGFNDCEVSITIDGEQMGRWLVEAGDSAVIEGPTNQRGRFTFYRAGSDEARQAAPPDAQESGIVSVWFLPTYDDYDEDDERPSTGPIFSLSAAAADGIGDEDADTGVTGFSGQVQQNPKPASPRAKWNMEASVLIELRLVSEPIPAAAYEKVTYTVFDCPDCQQPSKVPAGMGAVRVKCPACFCLFIRQT